MESTLAIETVQGEELFRGESADVIFNSLDRAGKYETPWSHCVLSNGTEVIYVMKNICSIAYKKGTAE